MDYKNFIAIGKIVKPIGLKGNLKVIPLTDFPDRFNKLKSLFLYDESGGKFLLNKFEDEYEFLISECRVFNKYISIRFKDFFDINISKELVNMIVMIDEKEKVKLESGNYYYYELIGAEVFDKEKFIGEIISINDYGSGDLLNIKIKDKEILIPNRKEFVRSIDIKNKRVDVDLIEGFLD